MRRQRAVVSVVVTGLVAVAAWVGTQAPAMADTQKTRTNHYAQGYSSKKMVRFFEPNMCVRAWAQGAINFDAHRVDWTRNTSGGGETVYAYYIDNVKLRYNTLTIDTYKPNGSTCTSTAKDYKRIRLEFKSRAYSCSWNPSVSASFPFSVGVSGWPSCGDKNLARWTGTDTNGGHHFKMSNSSGSVTFKGRQEQGSWYQTPQSNLTWGCYGVAAKLSPQSGTAVDTKNTPRMRVCPTWSGSLAGW
jgi:hypothetical protein